jgi:trehalose/maltose hydrolase-like predicted phosphorylase
MVNMPNWLPLTFRPEGGEWFDLDSGDYEMLEYIQELDLKKGVLTPAGARARCRQGARPWSASGASCTWVTAISQGSRPR